MAKTYTVRRGDSLNRIAAAHGVSSAALLDANREVLARAQNEHCSGPVATASLRCPSPLPVLPGTANPDLIFEGMVLAIPAKPGGQQDDPPPPAAGPSKAQAVVAAVGGLGLVGALIFGGVKLAAVVRSGSRPVEGFAGFGGTAAHFAEVAPTTWGVVGLLGGMTLATALTLAFDRRGE